VRLIARFIFFALVRGVAFAWIAFNGGLFMSDPEARLFKIAFTLLAAMVVASILLDWFL
jgi:hypothetical protein